ncbi:MAG: DUF359 domain-containing protein [Nitrososphaerota archaeon]|nr:DUF359 domain-containing protein [Nitrososphaerales archaeon]MCX8191424.1 DUF359 domain-containing protein [Nitrososphaerales archaeon]MDW8045310.1 DUF359 domain-containing protein [Nitrososphaerota archaeon]
MTKVYQLPERLREELKKPLGRLIDNEQITSNFLEQIRHSELIVTVGDATTERLIRLGLIPTVQVVDGREMRSERPKIPIAHVTEIYTENPAGSISEDALQAVIKALKAEKPVRIFVKGEEDLLTLLIIALYPLKTLVLYGQPKVGVVLIHIDRESKENAFRILKEMGLELNKIVKNDYSF